MSFFFIINPNSGKKKEKKFIENFIREESQKRKLSVEITYTREKGHASSLAFEARAKGFTCIVAVGGDGTIRETASSLVGKIDSTLGIIPLGSGNGLARNLSLPLDWKKAVEVVFNGNEREIDVGLCNGDIFLCSCGFGIDALIAQKFNSGKHARGILPYFVSGIKSFIEFNPKMIRIKQERGKSLQYFPLMAAVMNGRQFGGGAIVNPNGMIDDGFLELVIVPKMNFWQALYKIRHIFNGKIIEKKLASLISIKNTEIIIEKNSVYHLDGEDFISTDGLLKISVMHRKLRVIC